MGIPLEAFSSQLNIVPPVLIWKLSRSICLSILLVFDQAVIQKDALGPPTLNQSAQFIQGTATISERNFVKHPGNHFHFYDAKITTRLHCKLTLLLLELLT